MILFIPIIGVLLLYIFFLFHFSLDGNLKKKTLSPPPKKHCRQPYQSFFGLSFSQPTAWPRRRNEVFFHILIVTTSFLTSINTHTHTNEWTTISYVLWVYGLLSPPPQHPFEHVVFIKIYGLIAPEHDPHPRRRRTFRDR